MTPDWSMDLKRMVRGNGNLTVTTGQHLFIYQFIGGVQVTYE